MSHVAKEDQQQHEYVFDDVIYEPGNVWIQGDQVVRSAYKPDGGWMEQYLRGVSHMIALLINI